MHWVPRADRGTYCIRGKEDFHGARGSKVAQTHGNDTPELQKVLFRYCSREATDTQARGRHGMFSDWSGRAPTRR